MPITYFFRKRSPGQHSIEELFKGILEEIGKVQEIKTIYVPQKRAWPFSLLSNIIYAKKYKGKINHITGDVQYLGIGLGRNTLLTVHDIGSALKGNFLRRLYILIFWIWWPALCVNVITVISEFSRKELQRYLPFAKSKLKVIHNPWRQELLGYEKHNKNSGINRILLIGTKSNKNLERLMEALQGIDVELIIIGRPSDKQLTLAEKFNLKYEERFDLSYDQVIHTYLDCDLLCFPSLYEGFGMPILEAQVLEIPVLTSDLGAMKEVAEDSAHLVDPYSVKSIRGGIIKIMEDKEYREELVRKGKENIKRFEPEKIARQYMQVYKEIRPDLFHG